MAIDTCSAAQEMILEQFIAEASAARAAFHVPGLAIEGDAQFLSYISFDEAPPLRLRKRPALYSILYYTICVYTI